MLAVLLSIFLSIFARHKFRIGYPSAYALFLADIGMISWCLEGRNASECAGAFSWPNLAHINLESAIQVLVHLFWLMFGPISLCLD